MNDIEIVEEFIDYTKNVINDMEYERPVDVTIDGMTVLAIENLLKEIQEDKERIKQYEEMITNHKKQLRKGGIYGFDYDLKLLEESDK